MECHFQGFFSHGSFEVGSAKTSLEKTPRRASSRERSSHRRSLSGAIWSEENAGFRSAHMVGYPKIVGKTIWSCNISYWKLAFFHGYVSLPEGKLKNSFMVHMHSQLDVLFPDKISGIWLENCLQRGNSHRWLFHDHPKDYKYERMPLISKSTVVCFN